MDGLRGVARSGRRLGSAALLAALIVAALVVVPAAMKVGGSGTRAAGGPLLVAAGDISCDNVCDQGTTAGILGGLGSISALAVLGDAQYPSGYPGAAWLNSGTNQGVGTTLTMYQSEYGNSGWASYNSVARPVPGFYDWGDLAENNSSPFQQQPPYFSYFSRDFPGGANAGTNETGSVNCGSRGTPCSDWYSYTVGSWTVIALDSECGAIGGCGSGSAEETFLRQRLAAATNTCILAYWHTPRYTNSDVGDFSDSSTLWSDLYAAHAALVLGGHAHDYEHLAPMNAAGATDQAEGLTEFVVGTGGAPSDGIHSDHPVAYQESGTPGVLALTLNQGSADYRFATSGGNSPDQGTVYCITTPSAPSGVTAVAGNKAAQVSWNASATRPPQSYTVTPVLNGAPQTALSKTVNGSTHQAAMSGLVNGTAYTFQVTASNSLGTGPASTSNAITPSAVPAAPTNVVAQPGNGFATVTWTPPADTGGSPLTGYTVTPFAGTTALGAVHPGAGATSAVVTGLTNGTSYTFTVAASNAQGASLPASSNAVTPAALGPAAPAGNPNQGYWLVASDGGIFNYGNAHFFGSAGAIHLNRPIVGMAGTPDGDGYWLVASDGGIFNYGDAGFFGSAGGIRLNKPIVGMAATPDGGGYWLVASDGGIFNYGDAGFFGSAGGIHLNQPIVGMAPGPNGGGYWLVATDGGIFNYGVPFLGSAGAIHLNKPVVGMAATPDGVGYWLVATDGGIFNYGDASFEGSAGATRLNNPVVGIG